MELASPLNASKLETCFSSPTSVSCVLSKYMNSIEPVQVASSLEHQGIRYGKGQFLFLPQSQAVEIVSAVHDGKTFFLLVNMLTPVGDQIHPGRTQWVRTLPQESSRALLPITDSTNSQCSQCMYIRHNNTLWLLQWLPQTRRKNLVRSECPVAVNYNNNKSFKKKYDWYKKTMKSIQK